MKKRLIALGVTLLAVAATVPFLVACGSALPDIDSTGRISDDPEETAPTALDEVIDINSFGEYVEIDLGNNTQMVVFGSDEAGFCVTANLLVRNGNALLIDTKFTKTDAQEIVNYLRSTNTELTDIFISHGDPDYYFGLERIKQAYPTVIAQTTPSVAQHITNTMLNKLQVWGEVLGEETPNNLVVPQIYENETLTFEGLEIEIFGSDRSRVALYIPELNTVVGGPTIVSGNHMFLADMSTPEDRQRWMDNLVELKALNPETVIPGHSDLSNEDFTAESIDFSIAYLEAVNEVLPNTPTSEEFISAMEDRYPGLLSREVLVLAGQVLTGEMVWQ